jgi:clan AA aspartic protease
MIEGTVRNREALVELTIAGPTGLRLQIEAVIDTGYNGYLTLPESLVNTLQLPFSGHRRGMLADGSVIRLDVFLASLSWRDAEMDILVLTSSGSPLLGMSLLDGNRLSVDVAEGGDVSIIPLT